MVFSARMNGELALDTIITFLKDFQIFAKKKFDFQVLKNLVIKCERVSIFSIQLSSIKSSIQCTHILDF